MQQPAEDSLEPSCAPQQKSPLAEPLFQGQWQTLLKLCFAAVQVIQISIHVYLSFIIWESTFMTSWTAFFRLPRLVCASTAVRKAVAAKAVTRH